jgi:predicted acyltransferase
LTSPEDELPMAATEAEIKPSGRLMSIDALRGFDMFWIIGGDELGRALGAWSGTRAGQVVAEQLEHVPWEGFHFYDLIFPLFLFLVGVVLPFSMGKLEAEGTSAAYRRIARRTALLFFLGLLYNDLMQFRWADLRVTGVLQRIALCYGIAAVINLKLRTPALVVLLVAILLGYWGLLAYVAAPGGTPGDYSIEGNLAGWVDRHYLPGKIYEAYYGFGDNEGLLSTIPAVGTALLGVLAGRWLRAMPGPWVKVAGLVAAGAACVAGGFAWDERFPIIKNLWTSSFVLVAGGFSLILLGLFYAVIDVLKFRRWAFVFVVIGANAITIYFASRFVPFDQIAQFFLGGFYHLAEQRGASDPLMVVLRVAGTLAAEWIFLWFLYRNRIFLRA